MVPVALQQTKLTADGYFALPPDGDRRYQLVDGELVLNQPTARHGDAQFEIVAALRAWARSPGGFGRAQLPIDVVVDRHNVYAPDVLWVADAERIDPDAGLTGLPDLAVEIRSPSTWRYDIGAKRFRYEQQGLPELWLVDLASRSVIVCRRSSPEATSFDVALELGEDETLTSPQLPGFAMPVAGIFER
jgi:Uma2 family endonuclease